MGLSKAAREAGIFVFGGFEAASSDGVHFLCLYDPDQDSWRFIGIYSGRINSESDLGLVWKASAIQQLVVTL